MRKYIGQELQNFTGTSGTIPSQCSFTLVPVVRVARFELALSRFQSAHVNRYTTPCYVLFDVGSTETTHKLRSLWRTLLAGD